MIKKFLRSNDSSKNITELKNYLEKKSRIIFGFGNNSEKILEEFCSSKKIRKTFLKNSEDQKKFLKEFL